MRLDRYVDGRKVSKCAVFTSRAGNQIMAITVGGQVMLACCDVCRCFGEQFSLDSCRREDVKQYVYFDAPRGRNGVAKKTIFAPARLLIGYIRTRYPRKNTEIVRWIQTEIVPAMAASTIIHVDGKKYMPDTMYTIGRDGKVYEKE